MSHQKSSKIMSHNEPDDDMNIFRQQEPKYSTEQFVPKTHSRLHTSATTRLTSSNEWLDLPPLLT